MVIINRFIMMTTWFVKSLLPSLFQREEFPSIMRGIRYRGVFIPLFGKEGFGEIFLLNVRSIISPLVKI
jgi:hypothetical protein